MVAETSSWGKNVSSVNLSSKELLPTLELPISNNFNVGIDWDIVVKKKKPKRKKNKNDAVMCSY